MSLENSHDSRENMHNLFEMDIYKDVSVILTDYGKSIIKDQEIYYAKRGMGDRQVREKYTNGNVFDAEKYVENEIMPKYDGLCKFTLGELMKRFGEYISGGALLCFEDGKIYIEENEKSGVKRVSGKMAEDLGKMAEDLSDALKQ